MVGVEWRAGVSGMYVCGDWLGGVEGRSELHGCVCGDGGV